MTSSVIAVTVHVISNNNNNNKLPREYIYRGLKIIIITTSLPKVIWEQGRVADLCQGASCHQGSRIHSICIVYLRDMCRVYA